MTEEMALDHKTFDIVGVLSGRDYPTLEVPVYFNEALGFRLFQLLQKRKEAFGEELDAIDREYRELQAEAKSEEFTVLIKAIPESVRRDVLNKVREEFPPKKDLLGREEENPRGDEEYSKRMWAVYLQKITNPEGAVAVADEAAVNALFANAPTSVHEAINKGIAELQLGPQAAFEELAQDAGFLSDASPEG